MKKILSFLASAGFVCAALSGCVDDNQYVVARGLVVGDCNATSEDQTYFAGATCNPSGGGSVVAYLQVMNYITGEVPWSSSGGGSGTTFETTIINPGLVYIDKIIIKCKAIDGDSSGCDGTEPIEISTNVPVNGSGGGTCAPVPIDFGTIAGWGGNSVTIDAYAKYHDSSLIKGETSHVAATIMFDGSAGSCNEVGQEKDDEKTSET